MIRNILGLWNRYSRFFITFLFAGWGIYLRVLRLAGRDFWVDEFCSLQGTQGALKPFWKSMTYGAELTAFPGHYLVTWPCVQIFGPHKWGIMIPSIVSTVIGFYFLHLICLRYLKNSLSHAIVFALACFNPELIFHSFEFRPYAILSTLSLVVFYFLDTIVSDPAKISLSKKVWIGGVFVFTIIYHAYGVIILFFITVFFLLRQLAVEPVKEVLRKTWRFLGAVLLITIPLFLWYAAGSKAVQGAMWMDTFQFIPNPIVDGIGFLKAVFCNLTGHPRLYFLFLGIIISFLIPHERRLVQMGFFAVIVIAPVMLLMLIDLAKNYWFLQRQFIWVTPLFLFFIGWCWDEVFLLGMAWLQRKRS